MSDENKKIDNNYCLLTDEQIAGAVAFHGHHCPGLTIGLRAAEWCLRDFGKAGDEDIVAVVETDMCAVDAIQFLTGCTFGKGNFIYRDYGKTAFSFFRRSDNKRGRIVLNPNFAADLRNEMEALPSDQKEKIKVLRQKMIDRMMTAPFNEMFLCGVPDEMIPAMARLHKTVQCDGCGEGVMEPRLYKQNGKRLCCSCLKKFSS